MVANDVFNFDVAQKDAGLRLDTLVAANLNGCSRSYAALLIRQGHVKVDGAVCKPSYHVKTDEAVSGRVPPPEPLDILPEPIPLDILFEDRHLIVVNKPAGLVVHPAAGHAAGTLVNALLHHCPNLEGIGGEQRPGIVHRLDKETSGVLVAAKTAPVLNALSDQFKARTIQKQYSALVYGNPQEDCGQIDLPMGRHPIDRKKMATPGINSREALTLWQVSAHYNGATQLTLNLRTGRTHQIRVHCMAIGHPIVGDMVYGQRRMPTRLAKTNPLLYKAVKTIDRQMLHASQLGFLHPVTDEPLSFQAPLPADMARLIQHLDKTN